MNMVLTFNLSPEMVSVIGAGLGELPHKTAKPVIMELQRQINDQQVAKAENVVTIDPERKAS